MTAASSLAISSTQFECFPIIANSCWIEWTLEAIISASGSFVILIILIKPSLFLVRTPCPILEPQGMDWQKNTYDCWNVWLFLMAFIKVLQVKGAWPICTQKHDSTHLCQERLSLPGHQQSKMADSQVTRLAPCWKAKSSTLVAVGFSRG